MATKPSQIGENLRKAREAAGLTQADAAELLGVDKQTISRWERAERRIKAEDYERAVAAYGNRRGDSVGQSVPRGTRADGEQERVSPSAARYRVLARIAELATTEEEEEDAVDAFEVAIKGRAAGGPAAVSPEKMVEIIESAGAGIIAHLERRRARSRGQT